MLHGQMSMAVLPIPNPALRISAKDYFSAEII